ncbi:RNA-binding protein [Encephalitozoon intestinalis ATCC 50506]|uniref:RNA-binding protein n=1 Tax=Encephalitozoon intestinalis (strain ATCC 50506) TaxID=876142 RepID=E0S702_ENCIT|nr:RNA-binding protein [Encephalitozoon intestinalis ATCC 50506]ADM11588.1 RNA-binding protein [Encephalitozoon intestinalis ATCC 50506]UTX45306.1 PUA domain-containing protein [Encephalitozoon intestinalis]
MKNLFDKLEISSSCCLGKKDKKDINRQLGREILGKTEGYMLHKCRNRASVISREGLAILFCFNKKYFPTIQYLEKHSNEEFHEVFLDDGALGPLSRGADVMIPGILKYKDLVKGDFEEGDSVVIRILGKSIVGIGEAVVSFKDMAKKGNGIGIEVYHRIGDELYNEKCL